MPIQVEKNGGDLPGPGEPKPRYFIVVFTEIICICQATAAIFKVQDMILTNTLKKMVLKKV